jgi:hypothetical protein
MLKSLNAFRFLKLFPKFEVKFKSYVTIAYKQNTET